MCFPETCRSEGQSETSQNEHDRLSAQIIQRNIENKIIIKSVVCDINITKTSFIVHVKGCNCILTKLLARTSHILI